VTTLLAVVAASAAALILRSAVVWAHAGWFGAGYQGDASIHVAIIRQLRRSPRSRYVEQYLISPEPMSYPLAFHRFVSLLPERLVERKVHLPSTLIYVAAAGALAGYSVHVAGLLGRPALPFAGAAVGVFLWSPASTVFDGPAISYLGLSERLLGRTSCALALLLVHVGAALGDSSSLWVAIPFVALAVGSSIFARQVLLFALPLASIGWWDARPAVVLLAGAASALLLSRERLLHGLRHTVLQWRIYATHTKRSRLVQRALSRFVTPAALWRARHDLRSVARLVLEREPTRTLLRTPEAVLLAGLIGAGGRVPGVRPGVVVIVMLTAYLATSTERLNHLGESYRYVEYGLWLILPVIVASAATGTGDRGAAMAVAYAAYVGLAVVAYLRWRRRQPTGDELGSLLDELDVGPEAVVFPIGMRLGADVCARRPTWRSFWWQPGIVSRRIYDDYVEEYPFLKVAYEPLFEQFGVTHVLCDKVDLAAVPFDYRLEQFRRLAESRRFLAYEVPGRA
jgi:hypothetical protein